MLPKPFFRSTSVGYTVGLGLVLCGLWCFHDAYARRGKEPTWLMKTLTPGM